MTEDSVQTQSLTGPTWRLRKHSDYQRVYKASRKQSSPSMTYFSARVPFADGDRPRVGLTVGKAIGKAVERNRIKRRMREAVRANLRLLPAEIAVVLHPRRAVLEIGFPQLKAEVERIFLKVAGQRIAAQMHAGAERVDGQAAQLRQPGSTETARTSGAGCAH